MSKKVSAIVALFVVAAIVLTINLIASMTLHRARIDLTEEQLYTLSPGSRQVLKTLETDVTARLFYSQKAAADLPQFKAYAERVIQMLREYSGVAGKRLTLEILDPRPDTEIEERAQSYGLRGIPTDTGERIYLGLVVRDELGHEEVVPFFSPEHEHLLEYDITKTIYNVGHPERKQVGVISSLPVMGQPQQRNPFAPQQQGGEPWFVIRQLRQQYDVEEIETDAESLPEDLDLLVLIHPKDLSAPTRYAIDQYVMHGGKVLAFVDPFCQTEQASIPSDNMQMRMGMTVTSNLPDLLRSWGLEMKQGEGVGANSMMPSTGSSLVVADPNLAMQVPTRSGVQDMIVWLRLQDPQIGDEEIVTGDLENMLMACAGSIAEIEKVTGEQRLTATPLFSTTDQANTIEDLMLRFGADPAQLIRDFKAGDEPLHLGWKVSGVFHTAFPEGRPVEQETEEPSRPGAQQPEPQVTYEPDPSQLQEALKDTTVIVVADVDMIADGFSVQRNNLFGQEMVTAINDNLTFALNAVENLTGSQALIALRSRGRSQRPFTKVQEIQRRAQAQWREEERRLHEKLQELNRQLNQLRQGSEDSRVLDEKGMALMRKWRTERAATQRELREVRRRLREDVERLGMWLAFLNIAAVPLVVVALGLGIALVRWMRRRRRTA